MYDTLDEVPVGLPVLARTVVAVKQENGDIWANSVGNFSNVGWVNFGQGPSWKGPFTPVDRVDL